MRIEAQINHRGQVYRGAALTDTADGGDLTVAIVTLSSPQGRFSGYGESKRMATDKPEPRVGRRFAIQRAADVASNSLRAAGYVSGTPAAKGWELLVAALGRAVRKHTRHTLLLQHSSENGQSKVPAWEYDVTGNLNTIRRAQDVLARAMIPFGTAWLPAWLPSHRLGRISTRPSGIGALALSREFRFVGLDNEEVRRLPRRRS